MAKSYLALILVLIISGYGCCRSDIGQAAELAAPHMVIFEEFDKWARRVCAADAEFLERGTEAFREAVFAPLRRDTSIRGAWIEMRTAKSPARMFSLSAEPDLPKRINWTTVRNRQLGEVQVSLSAPCPLDVRNEAKAVTCVLVSRKASSSKRDLRVTVAFSEK
jgi:hypothetical protein